jgi:hypothetical protein
MVSLREKPLHDKHSSPAAVTNADDGTIGTMSRKSTLQISLPGALTVSVFAPARYRVVKIACSYSEVVL